MNGKAMIKSPERNATSEQPAARIEVRWLPVEALEPDKRNARVHSDRQVARIADSIAAFGFNVPVLVDEKGGALAGHGRVLAARRLGLEEVPMITLDHLGEAERRAFMIADNRLDELASWDDARLGVKLEELKTLDLDFALSATGFEISEIDLRIGSVAALGERGVNRRPILTPDRRPKLTPPLLVTGHGRQRSPRRSWSRLRSRGERGSVRCQAGRDRRRPRAAQTQERPAPQADPFSHLC